VDDVEHGSDDMGKQGLSTAECWKLEPKNEDRLEREEPWDVVEDDREREALKEVEETENDPICQPLNVIRVSGGLEGFDGEISGEHPADKVGNRRRKRVESVEEDQEDDTTEESVALGDLGSLLESVKGGILGKLLVELVHVVVGLILSLDEGRVLLNFLRGRHLAINLA